MTALFWARISAIGPVVESFLQPIIAGDVTITRPQITTNSRIAVLVLVVLDKP